MGLATLRAVVKIPQIISGALLLAVAGCAHFDPKPLSPADTAAAFEKRSLDSPELRVFIEKQLGHELKKWPPNFPDPWSIELLTLAAFYHHPSLDVARAQWHAAQATEISAGARPNPTASLSPGYNFSTVNAAPGLSHWFPGADLDLPIETVGKRGLRIAVARHHTEVARLNLHSAAWKVRASVRDGVTQFRFQGNLAGDLEQRAAVQKRLLDLVEQRFDAGALSQAELSPVRLAYEKNKLEWSVAKENYTASRSRLADALGVPARQVEFLPMAIGLYSPQLSDTQLRDMRAAALQNRADLRAALADYAATQAALQLEIARQYPDIHLGTGYQWDQGDHKWTLVKLSLDLPLLNRNQGPIAEAKAKREEVAARFVELQAKAIADIDLAVKTFQSAHARSFEASAMFEALKKQEDSVAAQVKAGAADALDLAQVRLERVAAQQLNNEVTYRAELAVNQLEDALQMPLDRRVGASAPAPGAFVETNPRDSKEKP